MNAFDPRMTPNPRLTPARPDLAAKHLEGTVTAARFVAGEPREIVEPMTPLRRTPSPDSPLDTEALKGERVTIYEITEEGWAWGQLDGDGYVGYLSENALAPPGPAATHKVAALRTLVLPGPDIKLMPIEALPLGATLSVVRMMEPFAVTSAGGYVPSRHLAPIGLMATDFVAIAEQFLHTPYLWGGKTCFGLDCSGLVQIALNACGIPCPRDSDMQEQRLGKVSSLVDLQRGDLIFWKGHVAIARDDETLIHANAYHMAVAIEPAVEAIGRIARTGSQVTSVKRL